MENIEYPKIQPEKITKPLQLLAIWFIGLIFIDGLFILTAIKIENVILEYFLVIASILNVPFFLYLLFKLQTKFRAELQEDSYYSRYLDKSIKSNSNSDLNKRVELRNEMEEQILSIDNKLDGISKKIEMTEIGKDVDEIRDGYEKVLNIISHNLKSSLQGILSGAQLLEHVIQKANAPKEKMIEIIDRIQTNAHINFFTLDNIQFRNNDRISVVDNVQIVKDILYPIIHIYRPIAANRNIRFKLELEKSAIIKCDRNALSTAFYNLIENAVRYSVDSNDIIIQTAIDNNFLKIMIINKSFFGNNKLSQLSPGLGLKTSKQILEKHGGNIEFFMKDDIFKTIIIIPIK
jgi:signal transduction histidine kinase